MVRATVVGAGGISGAWFPPLLAEGVEVVAVVDLNRDAAAARIEEYRLAGAAAYDDLDAALAARASDFVVDLTVPAAHREVTCKALAAGRHVIGEKPIAESFADARAMVDAAERAGKLYMVSQSRRWNPGVLDAAAAVRDGKIGPLTALTCAFFLRAPFTGFRTAMRHVLLVDMAIHHFDLARKMGGVDPRSVYAESYNLGETWAEHGVAAAALFTMTGGVRFTYTGSWCARGRHNSWDGDWRLQGAEGSLHYEQDQRAVAYRSDGEGFTPPPTPTDVAAPQPEVRGQHAALRELLAYLHGGPPPQSAGPDNLKSFAMVCAAVESADTGKPVDIAAMLR